MWFLRAKMHNTVRDGFRFQIGSCFAALLWSCGLVGLPACGQQPPTVSITAANLDVAAKAAADGPIASPEPDWPQWNGPRRDGISEEKGLLPTWPEGGPRLLWKIGNLGRGWSSPIIVRRSACTSPATWTTTWSSSPSTSTASPCGKPKNGRSWTGSYPGARACCAYSEGKLYHMNAHGRVACLEAATGKELWAVDVLERFQGQNITWAMSECLLVDGPRVIVTPGGEKALMAALDKQSGRTVWTTEPLARGPGLALRRRCCSATRGDASWPTAPRRTASASMPTRASCFGRCR